MLFDEPTLHKLNRLTLVASQVRAGMMKGERRSTRRGSSVEFADYRDYTHGDDLRRLDWNIYARLERPFIKLLEEEEDLSIYILVDGSKSMDWGEGEQNKFQYTLKLAAALGAIALSAGDRLSAALLQSAPHPAFGPTRGQGSLMRYLGYLDTCRAAGVTDLNRGLRDYALQAHRPGLAILISDLFAPQGFENGLSQLQGRGYEVAVLHVLAPDEIEPPLSGDLRLVDIETGQGQEVSLDGGMRDLYQRRLLAWRDETAAYLRKRSARYLAISTATPWDKVVLDEMRKAAIVK